MRAASVLRRLERQAARHDAGRVLPIKTLSYENGLYHEGGLLRHGDRTYTEEEVTALKAEYQLIVVCYSDDPPPDDGPVIQMTWGDNDDDAPAA